MPDTHSKLGSKVSAQPSRGVPRDAEGLAKLIEVRPEAWEFLYFAGLLSAGLARLRWKRRDNELELSTLAYHRVADEVVADYLAEAFNRLSHVIRPLERVFAAQESAFGAPGEPGDPFMIQHFAEWLVQTLERLMDWSAELRAAGVAEEFEEPVEIAARAADKPISQVVSFIHDAVDSCDNIPDLISKGKPIALDFTLTISLDDETVDRAIESLRRALEAEI